MSTVALPVAPNPYYAKGSNARRRPKGSGSVYFRARDGLWMGYVPIGRENGNSKRKVVGSVRYCSTLKKLRDLHAETGTPLAPPPGAPRPQIARAREIAAHTRAEWAELYLASRGLCFYCGKHANPPERDHKVPISRGGHDGIDNIVVSCVPCNRAKYTRTADEFMPSAVTR